MNINQNKFHNTHRQGTLVEVNRKIITNILGFGPNMDDDGEKVTASWSFLVDGQQCAIWDYKGSFEWQEASTYGPDEALLKVFGTHYRKGI
jgi:hypothetical protein